MDGWMDVWMDVWMDGWMDGWMDVVNLFQIATVLLQFISDSDET